MKYKAIIETTNGGQYESAIETRYELEKASEEASVARPDAFVRIGDLYLRAGDIKTMRLEEGTEGGANV